MEVTYSQLYDNLLSHPVPEIKKIPKTFMEIAGYPHYENVVSNILQFFLSPEEEHDLGFLFIQSLLNCINSKGGKALKLIDTGFTVEREAAGLGQTRIDLLISSIDSEKREDKTPEQLKEGLAIIIECKVWAALYNNLDYYWDAVKIKDKTGVVLSLYPENNFSHKGFVNITFEEYLNEVTRNIGAYLFNSSDKHLIFLKEFFNNLSSLKTNKLMSGQYQFYFDNLSKINELAKMRDSITQKILDAFVTSGKAVGYKVTSTRADYYRCWEIENRNDVYFTFLIDTDDTTANSSIKVLLEIAGEMVGKKDKFINDGKLQEIAKERGFRIAEILNKGVFIHIMSKEIPINAEYMIDIEKNLIVFHNQNLQPIHNRVLELI